MMWKIRSCDGKCANVLICQFANELSPSCVGVSYGANELNALNELNVPDEANPLNLLNLLNPLNFF